MRRLLNILLVVFTTLSGITIIPEKTSASANYTWERYEIGEKPRYERVLVNSDEKKYYRPFTGYRSFSLDPDTGRVTLTDGPITITDAGNSALLTGSQTVFSVSGEFLLQMDNYFYYCSENCTPDNSGGQFSKIYQSKITPVMQPAAGTFKDYVTSNAISSYPSDGAQNGYWYKYVGTNTAPSIVVNQNGNRTITNKPNDDSFVLTGTVTDVDNEDVTVSATIAGITKQIVVNNTATAKNWTLTWKTAELASGTYMGITANVADRRGGVATVSYLGSLTVDKTPLYYWDKYSINGQIRGQLVQGNIIDLDGTYPSNGIMNGYWYIKKTSNNMFPVLTVDNSDQIVNSSSGKITLKGTASDSDGDTVNISATLAGITKSTNVTGSGSWRLDWANNEIPEGVYTGLSVKANDEKGGVDSISYGGTITVDKTAPIISVTPNKQAWTSDPISIAIQWSDALSGIDSNERKYKLTTSQALPASWDTSNSDRIELIVPAEGEWYLHLKATDKAGNVTTKLAGPFQYQQQAGIPTLRLNAVGADWAEVGWSLPTNAFADGYKYKVKNTITGKSWTTDYPTDRIREQGLAAGTSYTYQIKVVNHVGESGWSKQIKVLTLPAEISNLKVSFIPNNSGTINVSFAPVQSAESYLLSIKEGPKSLYEKEFNTAGTHKIKGLEAGKQYTTTVTAKNASGLGQSSVLGFLSLPAAPGEFQSAQIRETEVELFWNASSTASLYELLRDGISRYSGSDLTYTDTGLESGTEYDYSISAKNESGFGDIAHLKGVLTLPEKANLTVEIIEQDAVNFSIKPVHGAEQYVVLVNGVEEKELSAKTEHFKVDTLYPGTDYAIEVYARNRSGSGVADKVTLRTLPDKPKGLKITDIGENTAKLTWEPVQGVDKYKVSITDDVYTVISGTEIFLTDLIAGTLYQPKVYAGNATGYGAASEGEFLTLPTSPNLHLVEVKADQITLAWDKVESAKKYMIFNKKEEPIGDTVELSYTIKKLNPGETYTVYVKAVNDTGEGKKSVFTQRTLPANWTVDPNDPNGRYPISVGDRSDHSVVITVDPLEGADQYKVLDGEGNVVGIITVPEIATEIGGLESAKEYSDWTIIPTNNSGEGQAAPVPTFATLPSSDFRVLVATSTTSSLTIEVESPLVNEIFVYVINGKEIYRGKDKSFTVSGLTSNQSYTISVWTENSEGDKTEPKIATGKTQSPPESSSGGSASGNSSATLNPEIAGPGEEGQPSIMKEGTGSKSGFTDIDKTFAKSEILALYDKGIVKGVTDNLFEPNRQVTRVEFATMLVRALELQESSDAKLTFEDVQRTAWYAPELSAAVINGVAHGFSDKEFRPFEMVTREQAAKMISNAAYDHVPTAKVNFKDSNVIASWAKPEVAALTVEKIITGYPDETFKPKRNLTRAECSVLIYRALSLFSK